MATARSIRWTRSSPGLPGAGGPPGSPTGHVPTTTPTTRPVGTTTTRGVTAAAPAGMTANAPTFLDVVGSGATAIDTYLKLRNQQKSSAINKKIVEFNRKVDLSNLRVFLQRMKDEQAAHSLRSYEASVDYYAGVAQKNAARSQQAYYAARTRPDGYLNWLTGEETRLASEAAATEEGIALADIATQRARLGMADVVETRRMQAMRRVGAAEEATFGAQQRASRAEFDEHAGRRVSAQAVSAVGAFAERQEQRAAEGRYGRARTEAIEGAMRSIGSATAEGAARGVRGSFQQTAAAEVFSGLTRTLDTLEQEMSVDASKRLMASVGRERSLADTMAQLDTADARTHLGLTAARGRFTERHEARSTEFIELGQRALVRGTERRGLGLRGQAARQARQHATARNEIRRRQGAQEVAREGIQWKEAEAAFQRGRQTVRGGLTKGFEVNRAKWYAEAGQAIAQYQLDNMPDLPDYEGTQTRQAVGNFFQTLSTWV